MAFEINLTCPVCGDYMFTNSDDGRVECLGCGWVGEYMDMNTNEYPIR